MKQIKSKKTINKIWKEKKSAIDFVDGKKQHETSDSFFNFVKTLISYDEARLYQKSKGIYVVAFDKRNMVSKGVLNIEIRV